jgi:hypothetical protein
MKLLEEMLEKEQKDNKTLMQLIKHHTTEEAKNKVSKDVQMLNLFITMVS